MGMADAPKRDAGLASGIVNVSMQVAAALGIARSSLYRKLNSFGISTIWTGFFSMTKW